MRGIIPRHGSPPPRSSLGAGRRVHVGGRRGDDPPHSGGLGRQEGSPRAVWEWPATVCARGAGRRRPAPGSRLPPAAALRRSAGAAGGSPRACGKRTRAVHRRSLPVHRGWSVARTLCSKEDGMRVWWTCTVVAVASAAVGAVGGQMLHAQGTLRAYLVAEVQVTDPEAYQ